VTAAEEYGRWRDPMLELDVTDAAAELAVLARATQVADLLGGDLHEVVARLREQLVDERRRRHDGLRTISRPPVPGAMTGSRPRANGATA
jgi:hypothetical protein